MGSAPSVEMLGEGSDSFFKLAGGVAGTRRIGVGGSRSWRRRSCSRRRPLRVVLTPRHARLARSRTAQTRLRQLGFAGEPADDLDAAAGLTEGADASFASFA